jgi:ribosome maturation factor RimP
MNFRIAFMFTDNLSRLTEQEQKALKTTLVEIDEETWENLYRDASLPFSKLASVRIAVNVSPISATR